MFLRSLAIAVACFWGVCALTASAGVGFAAKVGEVLTTTELDNSGKVAYGGCAAALSPTPGATVPGCAGRWVSFDCAGEVGSKSAGTTKFSAAQLGLVADKVVYVVVDPTTLFNGSHCYVERINNTTLDVVP